MTPCAIPVEAGSRLGWRSGLAAVLAAALAMAATLPGRTHGLGLITTRLLAEIPGLTADRYAFLNLFATLAGSLLCLPCGWLLDRFSVRRVALAITLLLAAAVFWLAQATTIWELAAAVTLTRGLGQSMLSVVSLAIIGKSFPRRPGAVMGAYAVALTMLMAVGMGLLAAQVAAAGWRPSWLALAGVILATGPVLWLLTPRCLRPGEPAAAPATERPPAEPLRNVAGDGALSHATFAQALASPCFWVFALATSFLGLVSSGFSLFQQSIFAAYGLDEAFYHRALVAGLGIGLIANLVGGGLALLLPLPRLLAAALVLQAAALAGLPWVSSPTGGWIFVAAFGVAGGLITVLFFTIWSQAFGLRSLGRIQGAAQMLTVLASALGPLAVTWGAAQSGGYQGPLWAFSAVSLALALAACATRAPSAAAGDWRPARTETTDLSLAESTS